MFCLSIQPRPYRYSRARAGLLLASIFGPAALHAQTATITSLALSSSQVTVGTAVQLTRRGRVRSAANRAGPGLVLRWQDATGHCATAVHRRGHHETALRTRNALPHGLFRRNEDLCQKQFQRPESDGHGGAYHQRS